MHKEYSIKLSKYEFKTAFTLKLLNKRKLTWNFIDKINFMIFDNIFFQILLYRNWFFWFFAMISFLILIFFCLNMKKLRTKIRKNLVFADFMQNILGSFDQWRNCIGVNGSDLACLCFLPSSNGKFASNCQHISYGCNFCGCNSSSDSVDFSLLAFIIN